MFRVTLNFSVVYLKYHSFRITHFGQRKQTLNVPVKLRNYCMTYFCTIPIGRQYKLFVALLDSVDEHMCLIVDITYM